jgi:hypothetical protein
MIERAGAIAAVALVAGIAAGATLCWFSFGMNPPVGCGSSSQGNTPLGGPPLALGTPRETTRGSDHWYNFTVQAAGGGLRLEDLKFEVQTAGGLNATPGADWRLNELAPNGSWLGTYSLTGTTAGTWTSGGTNALAVSQVLSLLAAPEDLSGDTFVVSFVGSGPCPAGGSATTAIP